MKAIGDRMNIIQKHSTRYAGSLSCRFASAMTLIELIVAVAIMIMIIVGVGYIFSGTATAVRGARSTAEIDTSLASFASQIRQDLQHLDRNGFMVITGGGDDASGMEVPPMFMFTATGFFEPQCVRTDTSVYTTINGISNTAATQSSNSALIIYMPFKDEGGDKLILMRCVYRFVGRTDEITGTMEPLYIEDQFMSSDYRNYAASRYSGSSPADYARKTSAAYTFGDFIFLDKSDIENLWAFDWRNEECVYFRIVKPIFDSFNAHGGNPPTISTSPVDMDEIADLWPFLIGGLPNSYDCFSVDFYDGKASDGRALTQRNTGPLTDGNNPLPVTSHDEWYGDPNPTDSDPTEKWTLSDEDGWINLNFDPTSSFYSDLKEDFRDTGLNRMGGSPHNAPNLDFTCMNMYGNKYPFAIWTGRNKDVWPKMLRFRLRLGDTAGLGETQEFELIMPVR